MTAQNTTDHGSSAVVEPGYVDWSSALAEYFLRGAVPGSPLYLSVDTAVIVDCARTLGIPETGAVGAFERMVRMQVVVGGRVNLNLAEPDKSHTYPSYLAFLGALVLAATRMGADDTLAIQPNAYFVRLRRILGLAETNGRPEGFDQDRDQALWKQWNEWLTSRGFRPTARPGQAGRFFIQYAISQAILRDADRERLKQCFQDLSLTRDLDQVSVFTVLRARQDGIRLTAHLKHLFNDEARRNEVIEAVFDAYEAWLEQADGDGPIRARGYQRAQVGLYRVFDPFMGQPHYSFLPRAPRVEIPDSLYVSDPSTGEETNLEAYAPGWLAPFGVVRSTDVNDGIEFQVHGGVNLTRLVLPARAHWLLQAHPAGVDGDAQATWGRPRFGDYFTILCRQAVVEQLRMLLETRLIDWADSPNGTHPVWDESDWVELRQVRVLARADSWVSISIGNRSLLEELRPIEQASIALSKGLRVPGETGVWLEGFPPNVTVRTFAERVELIIKNISTNTTQNIQVERDIEISLPETLNPGSYTVSLADGSVDEIFRIVGWEALRTAELDKPLGPPIEGGLSWGALIVNSVTHFGSLRSDQP